MSHKLIRITTVPISLEKLLEGQLAFMKEYYEVIAIASIEKELDAYGIKNEITTYHLELTRKITPLKDLKAVYKLYKFLKKEKPVIVHSHTPKAGIVGMMAAYFAGVPLRLHTVAGLPLMEATGFKRSVLNTVERWTYRFATQVYPNSKGLEKFIVTASLGDASKIKVLGNGSSNGIDTSHFNPDLFSEEDQIELRHKWNIPLNDFVFIFVGRLVSDKGINELVKSFIDLHETNPHTTLLLVGPFEEDLDPLDQYVYEAIIAHKKIVHTGYQDDVRPYFALGDALVFPSYREGFPNVVLQAGAMGLPAVVSNINGCNEIVEDRYNGLIIPVRDQEAVLHAMNELLVNNDLRIQLATNARPLVVDRYERQEVWNAILKEYQSLVK